MRMSKVLPLTDQPVGHQAAVRRRRERRQIASPRFGRPPLRIPADPRPARRTEQRLGTREAFCERLHRPLAVDAQAPSEHHLPVVRPLGGGHIRGDLRPVGDLPAPALQPSEEGQKTSLIRPRSLSNPRGPSLLARQPLLRPLLKPLLKGAVTSRPSKERKALSHKGLRHLGWSSSWLSRAVWTRILCSGIARLLGIPCRLRPGAAVIDSPCAPEFL